MSEPTSGAATPTSELRSSGTQHDPVDVAQSDEPTTGTPAPQAGGGGAAEVPARPEPDTGAGLNWARLGGVLALVVLALFCIVSVTIRVAHHPRLSPLDEAAHIDSVLQAPQIARSGALMLPETLHEISCRGIDLDWQPPPCGSEPAVPGPDYAVGAGGYNTADIHPPTYYFITKAAITVGGWFTDDDPVTLMRLTGGLWLALGTCLTWVLGRRMGASGWAAFGTAAVMASGFWVQSLSSLVNNDDMAIPAGAAFSLAAVAWWRYRRVWWVLPLAAAVLMMIKQTNFVVIAVICVYLITLEATRVQPNSTGTGAEQPAPGPSAADWWRTHRAGLLRAVGVSALTVGAAGVAAVGWNRYAAGRAIIPHDQLQISLWFQVDQLPLGRIIEQSFAFSGASQTLPAGLPTPPGVVSVFQVAVVSVLVGLTVVSWFRDRTTFAALLAATLGVIVMPWVYVVLNYVTSGQYFDVPYRYGFSMFPFIAAAVAAGLRRRATGVIVAGIGCAAVVLALVAAS